MEFTVSLIIRNTTNRNYCIYGKVVSNYRLRRISISTFNLNERDKSFVEKDIALISIKSSTNELNTRILLPGGNFFFNSSGLHFFRKRKQSSILQEEKRRVGS